MPDPPDSSSRSPQGNEGTPTAWAPEPAPETAAAAAATAQNLPKVAGGGGGLFLAARAAFAPAALAPTGLTGQRFRVAGQDDRGSVTRAAERAAGRSRRKRQAAHPPCRAAAARVYATWWRTPVRLLLARYIALDGRVRCAIHAHGLAPKPTIACHS
jgi:hypothetical protein